MVDADVITIGAGPVGMLAALLAANEGMQVVLLEQATRRHTQSRALGIMPPSLEILNRVGLAESMIAQGVVVREAEAYGLRHRLGGIDFSTCESRIPFVLSLPQDRTEALLETAVLAHPGIQFLRGHRVTTCREDSAGVVVGGECGDRSFHLSACFALACDGDRSTVRQVLGIPMDGEAERRTFLMGDFDDSTGWGPRARLFLTPRGSVESFPLPGDKRRYVLRTRSFIREGTTDYLRTELSRRTGLDFSMVRQYWESGFRVQRGLARSFCTGRIYLCGDAAHLMSPVGGQNMNTGFADAELASWLIRLSIAQRASHLQAARLYQHMRQQAARAATRRAQLMTLAGTSGGRCWSVVRNSAILVALHTPVRRFLARSLNMRTRPFRSLEYCRPRFEQELLAGSVRGTS